MTTLGNVGVVSVDDRAVECLTAIAYVYEDAMDDLAFLQRTWEAALPPSVAVARLVATAMSEPLAEPLSEPLVAAEPTEQDEPELAVMPVVSADRSGPVAAVHAAVSGADLAVASAADLAVTSAADLAVAELETATDLQVVAVSSSSASEADAPAAEEDHEQPDGFVERVRVLMIAEAATAEIPVPAAA